MFTLLRLRKRFPWIQTHCLRIVSSLSWLAVNLHLEKLANQNEFITGFQPILKPKASMAEAPKKLDVYSTTSEASKTYVFHDEDHTLGNALRYILMRKWVEVGFTFYQFCWLYFVALKWNFVAIRFHILPSQKCIYDCKRKKVWCGLVHSAAILMRYYDVDVSSDEVLREGLQDLYKLSSHLNELYWKELSAFSREL